jgi:O-antigen/teichoic acid export membrane protein
LTKGQYIKLFKRFIVFINSSKLAKDISWTSLSFVVLALSGLVINISILAFKGSSVLGMFNISYVVYLIFSQFASWGVHYSVLRQAAHSRTALERNKMLTAAIITSFICGSFFAFLFNSISVNIGTFFNDENIFKYFKIVSIGLIFFPLNKVLLAYLNGIREMKFFSALQIARYTSLMISIICIANLDLPNEFICLSFFFAEALTLTLAVIFLKNTSLNIKLIFSVKWIFKHIKFGSLAMLGGMFSEANTRIDILIVGYFLNYKLTGVYSFVAMLADGLYSVLAVIRTNYNPIIVSALRDKNWQELIGLRNKSFDIVLPSTILLSTLLLLCFYILSECIMPNKDLNQGMSSLIILLFGINLICIFVPFDNMLVISGKPIFQTLQQALTITVSLIASFILIPFLGLPGAALGMALGYFSSCIFLIIAVRKLLQFDLLKNKMNLVLDTK